MLIPLFFFNQTQISIIFFKCTWKADSELEKFEESILQKLKRHYDIVQNVEYR